MKVLVLGSGAKDHAIAWWFSKSRLIESLYVAPGNPGTSEFAVNLSNVDPSDKKSVLKVCKKYGIDFVFIGTEAPLEAGVIDFLNQNNISTFGAPGYALKLESDRRFSREFAKRNNIPMPDYRIFSSITEVSSFLKKNEGKTFTIKPNSLSPSRIVVNSSDYDILIEGAKKHLEKGEVLLEDSIEGLTATLTVLVDEKGYLSLPICSEYSKREKNEAGVITGGMGAICPLPINDTIKEKIRNEILFPTLKGLEKENLFYKGVLTFAIMIHDNQPYLLDYHVRFNDPATQTFVPLINNDLVEIMQAMLNNTLSDIKLVVCEKCSLGVVIASDGYPQNTKTGEVLNPVHSRYKCNMTEDKPLIFFGAVDENEKGEIRTTGGRAATIVGLADNIIEANSSVYKHIDTISFNGAWHREDIGLKFFTSNTQE